MMQETKNKIPYESPELRIITMKTENVLGYSENGFYGEDDSFKNTLLRVFD